MRWLWLLLPALPVGACLWDTDTLAMEAQAFPDMVEVSVGRFERIPPLYYELRLKRVAAELARAPGRLELYDDAGVACDRLGRDDEAIEWMRLKAERLTPDDAERRYRYLANLGTFHIHRWLRAGGRREDLRDARRARHLLAEALQLNPDAHFGRERYQLAAIDTLLDPPVASRQRLPTLVSVEAEPGQQEDPYRHSAAAAAKGLAGLVVLGNGWQSVDVYHALAVALTAKDDNSLARLAQRRAAELARAGQRSLLPGAPHGRTLARLLLERPAGPFITNRLDKEPQRQVDAAFVTLRAAAGRWHTERTAFMLARLTAGRHPDTDPHFWDGWRDQPLPALASLQRPAGQGVTLAAGRDEPSPVGTCLLAVAPAAPLVLWLVRRRRRKTAGNGPAAPN